MGSLYSDDRSKSWKYADSPWKPAESLLIWKKRAVIWKVSFINAALYLNCAGASLYLEFLLCVKEKKKVIQMEWKSEEQVFCNWKKIRVYLILFGICLLAVLHIMDYRISFLIVLLLIFLWDRKSLKRVDYSLLLTFVAFFIFIGNAGRISAFSLWLNQIIEGREVIVAVLASQIISNVPTALLLSGFTNKISLLIIGTNLGGFGTLIASMASLISYRQIAQEETERKGKYFLIFTISNVIFLLILLGVWRMTGVQ